MTTIRERLVQSLRLDQSEEQRWPVQAIKFLAVGVLNTLVDAGLYLALTRWLGLAALPTLAKGISYGAGVLNSFYWNRSWTFRSDANTIGALIAFVLANLAALALNAGIMHLGLNMLQLPESIAFVAATGSTPVWSFTISKFVVFRR
jgi:putative flippase GtrA